MAAETPRAHGPRGACRRSRPLGPARAENRSYSEVVITWAGTLLVDGGHHRPAALTGVGHATGELRPACGDLCNASAVRSSQPRTRPTLPPPPQPPPTSGCSGRTGRTPGAPARAVSASLVCFCLPMSAFSSTARDLRRTAAMIPYSNPVVDHLHESGTRRRSARSAGSPAPDGLGVAGGDPGVRGRGRRRRVRSWRRSSRGAATTFLFAADS